MSEYLSIQGDEEVVERARATKEADGLTWSEWLESVVEVVELLQEERDADYIPVAVAAEQFVEASRASAAGGRAAGSRETGAGQPDPAPAPAPEPVEGERPTDDDHDNLEAALDAIEDLDWTEQPRGGRKAAREALRAVVKYIDETDGAKANEIRDGVFGDHRAGWPEGKAMNWWRNFVVERLGELRDDHNVVHMRGSGKYTSWHVGPDETPE